MQSTTSKIVLRSHKKRLPIANKIRDFVIQLIEKINTRSLNFVFFASPPPPTFQTLATYAEVNVRIAFFKFSQLNCV